MVFSGLKTTERHAHSYEPSYVTPGEDAMVSYDGHSGPDMKFVNNSKTAVGIKTSFSDRKLTISIYGNPILEEGVTLSMKSEKVKELDPPAPTYEADPTLQPGVEVEDVYKRQILFIYQYRLMDIRLPVSYYSNFPIKCKCKNACFRYFITNKDVYKRQPPDRSAVSNTGL